MLAADTLGASQAIIDQAVDYATKEKTYCMRLASLCKNLSHSSAVKLSY